MTKKLSNVFLLAKKKVKLNVVFRSSNRIRNAFWLKDQILKYMNSKVVYKFECNICNGVYIGETKLHFLVSEYEHLEKSILTEKNLCIYRKRCYCYQKALTQPLLCS